MTVTGAVSTNSLYLPKKDHPADPANLQAILQWAQAIAVLLVQNGTGVLTIPLSVEGAVGANLVGPGRYVGNSDGPPSGGQSGDFGTDTSTPGLWLNVGGTWQMAAVS